MSGSRPRGLSRRAFAALLVEGAALWSTALSGGSALAQDPLARDPGVPDRGLGGTGVAPIDPQETLGQDRGIGGTGVVGTIRRFGSIVVNDLRVTFPPRVPVSIDGRPATLRDLRVGHVVRVLARPRGGGLRTRAIVVHSEVVGPLQASAAGTLTVLGQRILLGEDVALPPHRLGDVLAVSGLRRPDGAVVASLVERRERGPSRLRGPVVAGPDGGFAVGGTRVANLSPALLGREVRLVGRLAGGAFRATSVAVEPRVPFATADRLSLEAYVARGPEGLRLGSGLDVAADEVALDALDPQGAVRAVVVARPGPAGRLDVESLRVEHDSRGSGRGSGEPGRPGGPPGGPPGREGDGRPTGFGGPEGPDGTHGGTPGGPGRGGPAGGAGAGGGPGGAGPGGAGPGSAGPGGAGSGTGGPGGPGGPGR